MIVVAIIGLLAAVAIPNFVRAREKAQTGACLGNLGVIKGAKEQWTLENNKQQNSASVDAEINNYIKGNTTPTCPRSGTDSYNLLSLDPTCSADCPNVHMSL